MHRFHRDVTTCTVFVSACNFDKSSIVETTVNITSPRAFEFISKDIVATKGIQNVKKWVVWGS